MELWWCLDCLLPVELNTHARCERCGSEAVDTMERAAMKCVAAAVPASPEFQQIGDNTVRLTMLFRWYFSPGSARHVNSVYSN